jgi:hypothetical protein
VTLRDKLGRWASSIAPLPEVDGQPGAAPEAGAADLDWPRLAAAASAMVDRLDRKLGAPDPRLKALRGHGWTEEGVAVIEEFAIERGISDPVAAAKVYELEHPQPQPAKGGGSDPGLVPRLSLPGGGLSRHDPREEERDRIAVEALVGGNEEGFLRYMVPNTLKRVRQEMRDWRFE